ncbi:hypothetical protein P22_0247 [Propionispora sp. 2/2-37]|uniref:DNA mismatch repair endonuclease MutL n=1 Tax=Propionispora sp. 2/2-37 TaxID=1677858 RepID=UPI0006BB97E3|nr:DNA mismatch repair endonuclease MutL [Propionispora sp. 2/2-37]CUH94181.1 hypothetical protein P22_0247 [Propionispora sp. 2/2-37]
MNASIIRVLDENTANKIAAGEVVERPASIVKELIENSLDAGSRTIEIEIEDGGTSFIRVTDDGSGMSSEDAKLSVVRHATSKIREVEDLECISSLGFRGEALPSIAAVAKFTLTTRLKQETLGTFLEIQGGTLTDMREGGSNIGTTITVSDLFFNTPARRKFLKTPGAESSQIHNIVSKLALSHPEVSFKLINNQKLVMHTPGTNKLVDVLTSLYGVQVADDLINVNYADNDITISGIIGKPTLLKSSRQWQTYIVNLRVINNRFIAKAVDNAYHSLLPKTGYPLTVLHITVPLDSVDINVHPQKVDIKFRDEQKVFRSVYKAVTATLTAPLPPTQLAATVQLRFTERYQNANSFAPAAGKVCHWKQTSLDSDYSQQEEVSPIMVARESLQRQDNIFPLPPISPLESVRATVEGTQFALRALGQIEDCYILAQGKDGLYIIDQHAAHERILYDRMSKAANRIPIQQLLVPVFFEFDPREMDVIQEHSAVFYQLGFSLDIVGPNTVRLTEVPADISASDSEDLLRQILLEVQTMHKPTAQDLRHAGLQIASCRAAIKAGDTLTMRQIQALVDELCSTDLSYTCPHGRPAMIRFSPKDLAKMFKRT